MSNPIALSKDSQWIRYRSRYGQICIFRSNREMVNLIPAQMPNISLSVTRSAAAEGLREWRRKLRSGDAEVSQVEIAPDSESRPDLPSNPIQDKMKPDSLVQNA